MTTRPTTRIAALLAATTVVGAFAACGDTINNNGATCGAGTRLENGTCVAVTDATTPVTDGGEEIDSGTTDAGPADTGPDLNAEDPTPDDPCPVSEGPRHFVFNCDPKCGAVDPLCDANFCTRDGTLRPIEKVAPEAPSRFMLTTQVLSKRPSTNEQADKVTIRLPRNAATTLTCVTPFSATDAGSVRPLPRFMLFLPMSWVLSLNYGFDSAEILIAHYARVRARGFDIQPSHSRRFTRAADSHFDQMPLATSGMFDSVRECIRLDRKALVNEQLGGGSKDSAYRGFTGAYISTDRKLAATNIEVDLGNDAIPTLGIPEQIAPNCP